MKIQEKANGAQMALYWELIWSLHIPNKIKHLLWGASHDILPTCVNLVSKKVIPKGICFCCGKSNESLIHALWECKLSKKVWRLSMLGFVVVEQWHMLSFIDFFEKAKIVLPFIELEQFAYIWWMLWKARNDNLHGQGVHNPTHLLERIFELYEESHKSQEQPRACRVNQNEIWSCLLEGFYKLNVDGATDSATRLRSIGAVVRNDFGVFMGALAMQNPRGASILATKLQVIYRGVLFVTSASFSLSS
ncbi:uncharacterized protein LOC110751876 [Prunus avium]|uniref:Uncharacterized protein LOC110751876 n=1 Tax=Prunus avium TaxID=42229 RepID=A0A6P5S075_PRUAV|nr:uncharacterized protein LOC110751876 [Prunus avium]